MLTNLGPGYRYILHSLFSWRVWRLLGLFNKMKAHAYSVTRVQFSLVLPFRSGFGRGFSQPRSLSLSFFCCLSLSLALFLPSLSPFHEKGWLENGVKWKEARCSSNHSFRYKVKMSKIRYLWVFAVFSSTYQFLGFNFCIESRVYALVFCLLGRVRSLSTSLWSLTHLTALHLNDNNLARIPPDIAKLHNLVYLDLSSNKLRSLPAELGNMVSLRWGNIKDMIHYIKL